MKVFSDHCINNRQPEIAEETGSTFIAQTITDSIKIPTANLRFTTAESSKMPSSDCDSERRPEIATWLSKPEVLISRTITERRNSNDKSYFRPPRRTRSVSVRKWLRQRRTTGNSYISTKQVHFHFRVPVIVKIAWTHLSSLPWSKTADLLMEFWSYMS